MWVVTDNDELINLAHFVDANIVQVGDDWKVIAVRLDDTEVVLATTTDESAAKRMYKRLQGALKAFDIQCLGFGQK